MIQEIESFYLDKEEPNKSCLLALRDIILKQDANVDIPLLTIEQLLNDALDLYRNGTIKVK